MNRSQRPVDIPRRVPVHDPSAVAAFDGVDWPADTVASRRHRDTPGTRADGAADAPRTESSAYAAPQAHSTHGDIRAPPRPRVPGRMPVKLDTEAAQRRATDPASPLEHAGSVLASPAARFLGSFSGSFQGSSAASAEEHGDSMVNFLRRSSSTRSPRQQGALGKKPAATLTRHFSLDHHAKQVPRADEEGFVFGSSTRYRLGRAIGFGEGTVVREGWIEAAEDGPWESRECGAPPDAHGARRSTRPPPPVAIKVVHSLDDDEGCDDHRETRVWRTLPHHPHILALRHYERVCEQDAIASEHRVVHYLVMDFSPHGNLLQYVRRDGRPVELAYAQVPHAGARSADAPSGTTAPHEPPWAAPDVSVGTPHGDSAAGAPGRQSCAHTAPTPPLGMSGRAFVSYVRDRPRGVPLAAAREIMRQTASAIYCLHKVAGVVHCDLKLENILAFDPLAADDACDRPMWHWKVADFGLAEYVSRAGNAARSTQQHVGGTLAYTAPEVVRFLDLDVTVHGGLPSHRPHVPGDAPPDADAPFARDLWSLGCILYALLAGRLPFRDSLQVRLQGHIMQGDFELPYRLRTAAERREKPVPPSEVPDAEEAEASDLEKRQVRDVLTNLLQVDPVRRWNIDDLCQSPWLSLY
ncbi:hypothetical protein MSPP1_000775 [Malassezia sp. CBS 17886]|nr:hypothetical protein MSPP1_000775 [Malassezia sp. CBS 17886]